MAMFIFICGLITAAAAKAVVPPAAGPRLALNICGANASFQGFTFTASSTLELTASPRLCVDIGGASTAPMAAVTTYPCTAGAANQRFSLAGSRVATQMTPQTCLAAIGEAVGAEVTTAACDAADPLQRFVLSASTGRLEQGAGARLCVDAGAPLPPPPGPPLYAKLGAIDVGTYESNLVYWHGALLVLENIACSYKGHAGEYWPTVFGNHSYARLRDFATGAVLANITSTLSFAFISAFADYETDTLWLFGTPTDRCNQGNGNATTVQAWWTHDAALQVWSTANAVDVGHITYNVEVTSIGPRGGSSAAERAAWAARRAARGSAPPAFPGARYAMFVEAFTWLVNDAPDGDLSRGWRVVQSTPPPRGSGGGPAFTYSDADDFFYILTGGHWVQLFRTRDFVSWQESSPAPFIFPSADDALVSPFAGFAAAAAAKGSPPQRRVGVPENFPFVPFDPVWTANWTAWDRNSNDADFCCQHVDVTDAWVIWGADTQGGAPAPPLDGSDAGTNSVGRRLGSTLNELLALYFPWSAPA